LIRFQRDLVRSARSPIGVQVKVGELKDKIASVEGAVHTPDLECGSVGLVCTEFIELARAIVIAILYDLDRVSDWNLAIKEQRKAYCAGDTN
jgi:hypothetical protein